MPKVTFISADGTAFACEGAVGETLMEVGRAADVPNILADCGGGLACATCHVVVDGAWTDAVGQPGPDEEVMLDFGVDRTDASRLSCQVVLSEALDGLVVRVPEVQG